MGTGEREGSGMREDHFTHTERDAGLYERHRADEPPERPDPSEYEQPPPDRCDSCGHFLPRTSHYSNRCSDCWTPEDEFI